MSDGRETLESVGRKNVGRNALSAALEIESVNVAEGNDDFGQADSEVDQSVGLQSNAVTAVVVGLTAAGNVDALFAVDAIGLSGSAEASASQAVVEVRAVDGNVVTPVAIRAPISSRHESQTVAAVVVG